VCNLCGRCLQCERPRGVSGLCGCVYTWRVWPVRADVHRVGLCLSRGVSVACGEGKGMCGYVCVLCGVVCGQVASTWCGCVSRHALVRHTSTIRAVGSVSGLVMLICVVVWCEAVEACAWCVHCHAWCECSVRRWVVCGGCTIAWRVWPVRKSCVM
jgi:hypothetical protein